MTVTDTEPRYQLLDSNGNVVGSLHINGSGDLVLEEGTNQNEVRLESDGALETTANATLREGTNQNEATLDSTGTWTVPALDADEINNVRAVTAAADLQPALDNNDFVWVPPETSLTITEHTIPSDTKLRVDGTLTLADGADSNMFQNSDQTNGNSNIWLFGTGVLDGNKANQTDTGVRPDQDLVFFDKVLGLRVFGLELRNSFRMALQLLGPEADGNSGDYWIHDLHVHDTGIAADNILADGMFFEGENGHVYNNLIENVTDTPLVLRQARSVSAHDNIIRAGTDADRAIAVSYGCRDVGVRDNIVGADGNKAIEIGVFSGSTVPIEISINNNDIFGHTNAVRINDADLINVKGNDLRQQASNTGTPILVTANVTQVHLAGNRRFDDGGNDLYQFGGSFTDTSSTVEGRYINAPTHDLAGSATASITPIRRGLDVYDLLIDGDAGTATGTATLQQVLELGETRGSKVRLWHTGDDTVTIQDVANSGVSADGFQNSGGTDNTLDANGEMFEYVYDGTHWREMASNVS